MQIAGTTIFLGLDIADATFWSFNAPRERQRGAA